MSIFRFLKPADPLDRLVRLVATERDIHQIISRVAADAELIRECRQAFVKERDAHATWKKQLSRLCRLHRVLPDYFIEHVKLIAYTLSLARDEENEGDYYEILGVDPKSGREEIRRAFRNQSLMWHPDKNPDRPEASERFRQIYRAYEILSDEKLRHHYDRRTVCPLWVERDQPEEKRQGFSVEKKNRRNMVQLLTVVAMLLILSFLIGTEDVQTPRYEPVTKERDKEPLSQAFFPKEATREETGKASGTPSEPRTTQNALTPPVATLSEKVPVGAVRTETALPEKEHPNTPKIRTLAELNFVDKSSIPKSQPQPIPVVSPSQSVSVSSVRIKPPDAAVDASSSKRREAPPDSKALKATTHAVREGDTLLGIALAYNTNVVALCKLNGIDEKSSLRIGQELKVASTRAATIPPSPPLTEEDVPKKEVDVSLAGKKKIPAETKDQVISKAPTCKVQKGETLFSIALKHNISVATLCRLNGIDEKTPLQIGRELRLEPLTIASVSDPSVGKQVSGETSVPKDKKTPAETVPKPTDHIAVQHPPEKNQLPDHQRAPEKTEASKKKDETVKVVEARRSIPVTAQNRTGESPSQPLRTSILPDAGTPEPKPGSPSVPKVKEITAKVPQDRAVEHSSLPTRGERDSEENFQNKIRNFLNIYTKTYERKDLNALLRLFEPGALENGNRLANLIPAYQKNFNRAQNLRYHVELKKWSLTPDGVDLNGSFRLRANLQGESPIDSYGSIQIFLARHGDNFRIRRLNYRFSGPQ